MLCGNSSTQIINNLVLRLNVSSYELYQIDGYCIVQNINNLTIQGAKQNSTIRCVPVGSPGSGFGFINITNLLLANVHACNNLCLCGSMCADVITIIIIINSFKQM